MTRPSGFERSAAAAMATFPLTGDAHPLRQRSVRMLYRALSTAAVIHLTAGALFLIVRSRESMEPARVVHICTVLSPPPAINPHARAAEDFSVVNPPGIGVPIPVPDFLAPDAGLLPNNEIADAIPDLKPFDGMGDGRDSIVVRLPAADRSPAPDEFVAVEEMPALISFPAPVYPPLARQAEIDGTVRLRLLVSKEGKVKDVLVTSGIEMLNEVAVSAAKSARFRPALQQHRPVEVWVEVPVTFRLHE